MNRNIFSIITKYLNQNDIIEIKFVSNNLYSYFMSYESRLIINTIEDCIEKNQIISLIRFNFFALTEKFDLIYKYGHLNMISLIKYYNAISWDKMLYGACLGCHLHIAKLAINKDIYNLNYGLYCACKGGNIQIINLMIKRGANYWNAGLIGACLGGNLDIVNYIINKGATDWNCGLRCACESGFLNIINYMINKGATQCDNYRHGNDCLGNQQLKKLKI